MSKTKVITGKVRLSYAHLFRAHAAVEGQEPKYSTMILIPKKDKKTLAKIKAAQKAAAEEGAATKFGGKIPANLKTTLRDGDEEHPEDPTFKDHMFMSVSSKTRPGVVDLDRDPIETAEEVYSGCYARVSLNFYAYNVNGNKGVTAGLNNVQKIADGERLGGKTAAEDDFDDDFEWEEDDDILA